MDEAAVTLTAMGVIIAVLILLGVVAFRTLRTADIAARAALASVEAALTRRTALATQPNELRKADDQLSIARRDYNDAVLHLNRLVRTIPWMFFAGAAGIKSRNPLDLS
ncbi:hypothetical protein GOEFS_095_00300 [Gordonia effusa NBRC 100432]|uniref:LemA family protein n=1 Tax=Gordonia effusa NBRC 100432 TaxID=1077974 RepID=H0R3Z4_9ACTN|nr:LemA family protein [Gordonia effusa]GAB19795.1 hypothetical protein GOEFS_095_00300 [Gordonia effusa NBRC 100432]